jgi:hypothetical protein
MPDLLDIFHFTVFKPKSMTYNFLLVTNNTPICMGPHNSGWLLSYDKTLQNSQCSCALHQREVPDSSQKELFLSVFYPMVTGTAVYCIRLVVETFCFSTERIQVSTFTYALCDMNSHAAPWMTMDLMGAVFVLQEQGSMQWGIMITDWMVHCKVNWCLHGRAGESLHAPSLLLQLWLCVCCCSFLCNMIQVLMKY